MAEIPYVLNNGKIPEYFEKIQAVGVPVSVTHKWLQAIGFKSTNDRNLIAFLRDLGFIDNGAPTQRWRDYRRTDIASHVMADAIRGAYAGLFSMYPDASMSDDEAIRNWMRSQAPGASTVTIDRGLATFRAVCGLADFKTTGTSSAEPPHTDAPNVSIAPPAGSAASFSSAATININIELQLPASASGEDYELFFAAMRRHLIDGSGSHS